MWNALSCGFGRGGNSTSTSMSNSETSTDIRSQDSVASKRPVAGKPDFAKRSPPTGSRTNYLSEWLLEIEGAEGTVYSGEKYILRFRFSEKYPMESPEVVFTGLSPEHKHIYSNGHICLSILYDGWSPALNVATVCLSLISMLSSSEAKARPPGDSEYVLLSRHEVSPKSMKWVFDDDTV